MSEWKKFARFVQANAWRIKVAIRIWGKIISLLGVYRFKRNEEIAYGKIFKH